MSAFPNYDPGLIAALDAQADAILGVFSKAGYKRHEPSVLQPADIFLDRSGEEIRRRTFELTDPSGRELCLRPDLTIPTCKWQVESGNAYPARLCYHGLAFRHQPSEPHRPTQFYQAGLELLGLQDRAAADIETMRLTVEAVRAAGLDGLEVKIGDLGLFSALVDGLNVPVQWRGRLKRHFWRAGYFEALLQRMTSGAANDSQRLLAHLGGLGTAEARVAVEGLLDMVGEAPLGARTREEIVERLIEQAADAAALRLDPQVANVIAEMLSISCPAPDALKRIRALAPSLDAPLQAMQARLDTLSGLGIDPARVTFAARFGRNMEYYTGFVFELWSRDAEGAVQVAGGGRYDGLLEALGAGRPIPAIGSAIRTERVLAARRAAGRAE
ncbi:MAG: ATP phosphoribosyltransferase regulatory subunit [Alphaproteobacteria bacterium]|nr:ATP phosphoribosyltransferase regulatory subunit [Alphaproteobacteria bacterium]